MKEAAEVDLKQLTIDIRAGKVFHSNMLPEEQASDLMPMVFMPLGLMTNEDIANFEKQDPWILYEEISKAAPTAINGYPIFFSFKWLNKEQWMKVLDFNKKLTEAEEAVG